MESYSNGRSSTEAIFTPRRGEISHFGTAPETVEAVCVSEYHRVIVKVRRDAVDLNGLGFDLSKGEAPRPPTTLTQC